MIEKGKLIPDAAIVGFDGVTRRLWDFRQKSHVVALMGDGVTVSALVEKLAERQKTFTWLNVQVLATAHVPDGFASGAYLVDRFGELFEIYPLTDALPEDVERDFLHYEACHC